MQQLDRALCCLPWGKNECVLCIGRVGVWWMRRTDCVRDCFVSAKMVLFFEGPQVGYNWILINGIVTIKHFPFQHDKDEHCDLGGHVSKWGRSQDGKSQGLKSLSEKEPSINWKLLIFISFEWNINFYHIWAIFYSGYICMFYVRQINIETRLSSIIWVLEIRSVQKADYQWHI